jgi:putative tricarboxylic transport membrane protein
MLAGIYYSAQYGGSTTAILINRPGEASSVVTAIAGYQMVRRGRAGPALAIARMGSFFPGCVGTFVVAVFAQPLAELALRFGSAEYFALMLLGLIAAVSLAAGSMPKAIAMILLGLLLGQVNTDAITGMARFTGDLPELADGIGFTHGDHGLLRLRRNTLRLDWRASCHDMLSRRCTWLKAPG